MASNDDAHMNIISPDRASNLRYIFSDMQALKSLRLLAALGLMCIVVACGSGADQIGAGNQSDAPSQNSGLTPSQIAQSSGAAEEVSEGNSRSENSLQSSPTPPTSTPREFIGPEVPGAHNDSDFTGERTSDSAGSTEVGQTTSPSGAGSSASGVPTASNPSTASPSGDDTTGSGTATSLDPVSPTTPTVVATAPPSPPTTMPRSAAQMVACEVSIRPAGSSSTAGTPFAVTVSGDPGPVWVRISWSGGTNVVSINVDEDRPSTVVVPTGSTIGEASAEVFASPSLSIDSRSCSTL